MVVVASKIAIVACLACQACRGQLASDERLKVGRKVSTNTLSSHGASEEELRLLRPSGERLQALASAFFSISHGSALGRARTSSILPSRTPSLENSNKVESRAHRPARRCLPTMAIPAATDLHSDLTSAGKLVAEWGVATNRGQATIAVSGATSTPGVLRDFWKSVREFAQSPGAAGRERILAFPLWSEGHENSELFKKMIKHFVECQELSEIYGSSVIAFGKHPGAPGDEAKPPCVMMVLKAFTEVAFVDDEGEDIMNDMEDAELNEFDTNSRTSLSDNDIIKETRDWVSAVIVEMKVCPFSSSADMAGLPQGGVSYPITHATTVEEIYEEFWNQVLQLRAKDTHDLATVLLITSNFAVHSPGGYDILAETLDSALSDTGMGFEEEIQLVFFHPKYTFRDGMDRFGNDGAANYARRSPYPMINLLRTQQVRGAQKNLPTGQVYITNEENMKSVGQAELEKMLVDKDWSPLHGRKYIKHADNVI